MCPRSAGGVPAAARATAIGEQRSGNGNADSHQHDKLAAVASSVSCGCTEGGALASTIAAVPLAAAHKAEPLVPSRCNDVSLAAAARFTLRPGPPARAGPGLVGTKYLPRLRARRHHGRRRYGHLSRRPPRLSPFDPAPLLLLLLQEGEGQGDREEGAGERRGEQEEGEEGEQASASERRHGDGEHFVRAGALSAAARSLELDEAFLCWESGISVLGIGSSCAGTWEFLCLEMGIPVLGNGNSCAGKEEFLC
eukprot:6175768-Pleurochrysis_carterae.AAC.2